ncbi:MULTISPECIES: TRAP transporter substrate-binding protein DctP [unclassified Pseudonocardia]|uniref:TRAP transporter substrate-binding protein DctP n=1 Tax=Pseudonocardia sp. P1 TaxID=761194 RepID=UPI0001FFE691|nr:TRAP transporter solute receptor, unknown substrate 3 [Pseudonocardia sp. Ae707_Ps1]
MLTFSTYHSREHPNSRTFQDWMDSVTARTGGKIRFEAFYDGSLCPADETLSCVEDGRVDLAFDSPAFNPVLAVANVGSIAFQTPDFDAVTRAMNALLDEAPELGAEYRDRNQHVLFLGGGTPPVLALNDSVTVRSLDDLGGVSVRATGGMATGLRLLGMQPAAVEPSQTYEAIERGVVSGIGYSLDSLTDGRLHEVADQVFDISDMGVYAIVTYGINVDVWDSLDADVQEAMRAASDDAVAGSMTAHQDQAVRESCTILGEAGIEVVPLGRDDRGGQWAAEGTAVQRAQWEEATAGLLADPRAFSQRYVDLVKEFAPERPRGVAEACAEE